MNQLKPRIQKKYDRKISTSVMKSINTKSVDFENDHLIFNKARKSPEYKKLISIMKKCTKIYIIGNGGLMDVSSHAAADLSRLVPGKSFYSFNNAGFLTSNANDFGFDSAFTKWLQVSVADIENPATTLVIGLSCSGSSENIIQALQWISNQGKRQKYNTYLISGVKYNQKLKKTGQLSLGTKYFHTTEVVIMKLFYDIVYKLGGFCPTIQMQQANKAIREYIRPIAKYN